MPGFELIDDKEFLEVKEVFEKSKILFRHSFDNLRNGVYKVRDFEKQFSNHMGVKDALAVTSGTSALKVAFKALDIKKGDEVITQAFTFVATVEAIIECQAQPVIADIDKSLNIDPISFEKNITKKTKAVVVVHMLGIPVQMDQILKIAKKHNLYVIEDTAWGCGGKFNNKFLGTIGDVGTYSFDFAKTMTTGEGGMVICKDNNILEKAKAYHDHGHENNPSLPRWEDSRSSSGFNYRMMELQGAVGLAQLKKLNYVIDSQNANKNQIKKLIKDFPISFRKYPKCSSFVDTSDALVFFVENKETAINCRNELLKNSVGTKILPEAVSWHFAGSWDHMDELTNYYGGNLDDKFLQSREILSKAVSIPIFVNMSKDVPNKIYESLKTIFNK